MLDYLPWLENIYIYVGDNHSFLLRHYILYLGNKLVRLQETKSLAEIHEIWTMTELLHYVQVIFPRCL